MNKKEERLLAIKNLSQRRLTLLKNLGIDSPMELIRFFPRDYEDWTNPKTIGQIDGEEKETFLATVISNPTLRRKGKLTILQTTLSDYAGFKIKAVWFNQHYYKDKLVVGEKYYFRGKIKANKLSREIVNPTIEIYEKETVVGIKPIYRLTYGLSQGVLRLLIKNALEKYASYIREYLPEDIIKQNELCSIQFAYEKIHNPKSKEEYEIARKRLVFDELFLMQLGLKLIKQSISKKSEAFKVDIKTNDLQPFINELPFKLTDSQIQVIYTIIKDINSNSAMNRLVQGDVGSGKTVVGAAIIYACAMSGFQSVLMAPTFILAKQHFDTFSKFFEKFDITIGLLTGNMSTKEKEAMYEKISKGQIDFVVGTHALIQEGVKFKRLAFAVTDEQHRFGVKQRSKLSSTGDKTPHVLVMSATPIPRTLAFVLYGDLDISVIKGLPKGRVPIETYTANSNDSNRIYDLIKREVSLGRQAYIVTSLIEDSDKPNEISAISLFEEIKKTHLKELNVGLVHGNMKSDEKENVMGKFYNGEVDVLISTTVIEVGVDNPNATIMVVENAEKFGLAQLHQLRGRIGRGSHRSVCILKSDSTQEIAIKRLKLLCKTIDGFKLANEDLLMRGIGDFFGTRQHGIPEMKIANLYSDTDILDLSKKAIDKLISHDPSLSIEEHKYILAQINNYFGELFENIGL